MKAKLLFAALMLFCGITAQAQSDVLTATLTHNGVHTTYTGSNSLAKALANANHGDAIALSSGHFQGTHTITKAITLSGAGATVDYPTILDDDIIMDVPDSCSEITKIEGIRFSTVVNSTDEHADWRAPYLILQNCKYSYDHSYSSIKYQMYAKKLILRNVISSHGHKSDVTSLLRYYPTKDGSEIQIIQSLWGKIHIENEKYDDVKVNATNSRFYEIGGTASSITCNHCIIGSYVPQNSVVSNSLFLRSTLSGLGEFYSKITKQSVVLRTNWEFYSNTLFDKTYYTYFFTSNTNWKTLSVSTVSDLLGEDDQLTNYAKANCPSTDNTEIGIYGGAYDKDIDSSFLHFVRCTVPTVTDEEGKLNVKLSVSGIK
ncbi:MAG: hypothetical protein J6I52_09095 [Prevotella sp.]|nr:hypothetical protein [Prevotella sp.]